MQKCISFLLLIGVIATLSGAPVMVSAGNDQVYGAPQLPVPLEVFRDMFVGLPPDMTDDDLLEIVLELLPSIPLYDLYQHALGYWVRNAEPVPNFNEYRYSFSPDFPYHISIDGFTVTVSGISGHLLTLYGLDSEFIGFRYMLATLSGHHAINALPQTMTRMEQGLVEIRDSTAVFVFEPVPEGNYSLDLGPSNGNRSAGQSLPVRVTATGIEFIPHYYQAYNKELAAGFRPPIGRQYLLSQSDTINEFVATLIRGIDDPYQKAKAIYTWVTSNITPTYDLLPWQSKDDNSIENQSPERIMVSRIAHSTDYSLFTIALMHAAGIPAREGAIEIGSAYRWIQAYLGDRWVDMRPFTEAVSRNAFAPNLQLYFDVTPESMRLPFYNIPIYPEYEDYPDVFGDPNQDLTITADGTVLVFRGNIVRFWGSFFEPDVDLYPWSEQIGAVIWRENNGVFEFYRSPLNAYPWDPFTRSNSVEVRNHAAALIFGSLPPGPATLSLELFSDTVGAGATKWSNANAQFGFNVAHQFDYEIYITEDGIVFPDDAPDFFVSPRGRISSGSNAHTGSASSQPFADQNADITVIVNGSAILLDQPPLILDGRTLVPLRAIFEALGAEVKWEQSTQTITAVREDIVISLQIGSDVLVKNGVDVALDVSAQIVGGRTLVPFRAVSESFGAEVGWDQATRTVIIVE